MMYGFWDMEHDRFFCHFGPFFALLPPWKPKKSKFWKNGKILGDIIVLHKCTKNHNNMIYGSWHTEWDRQKFRHFGSLFALFANFWKNEKDSWRYNPFTQVHHKWRSYGIWFLKHKVRETIFFVILGHFMPFHPPDYPKNWKPEKLKNIAGDIIILHMFYINGNLMMHGSWDVEHDRQSYLSFWVVSCSFTHLTTQKIKILKILKKHLETCVP